MGAISLSVFIAYLGYIFVRQPEFFLKYLPFVFAVTSNIIGCALCEFGVFELDELRTTSHFVGSLPLLVLSRWIFLALLRVFDLTKGIQIRYQIGVDTNDTQFKQRVMFAFEIMVFALVAVSFMHVCIHPAFSEGMNRFSYNTAYMGGIWTKLKNILVLLMVIPVLAIRKNTHRLLGVTTVVLYCFFLFWVGEKFGGFYGIVCIVCFVYYDVALNLSAKEKAIMGGILAGTLAILLGFSLFAYSLMSSTNVVDYFGKRVAEQGQLWWKTYEQSRGVLHTAEFSDEIQALLSTEKAIKDNVGSNYGIYRIMYYTAPDDKVDRQLGIGARYTEGAYAAAYYYFGIVGSLLFSLLMALLVFAVQNSFIAAIWKCNPIRMCVFSRFENGAQIALSMFLFYKFFDAAAIISYGFLLVMSLMHHVLDPSLGEHGNSKRMCFSIQKLRRWILELEG